MISLTRFLKCLPGIRPRIARSAILKSDLLHAEELADLHSREAYYDRIIEVGPLAASAILVACKAGRLPMEPGKLPAATPDAETYLTMREVLFAERDARARIEAAVLNPSIMMENDLSDHGVLDRVFLKNLGTGDGQMTIAGILVSKTLRRYPSNSGKNQGWGVVFSWVGSDGEQRRSESKPPEAGNRRNDSDRNFGLPE